MKIAKLRYRATVSEVDDVTRQVIKAYGENEIESDSNLASFIEEMNTKHTLLAGVLEHTDAESNLDKKDIIRDDKYRSLGYIILGAVHNPDATIKEAGEVIQKVFDKYGFEVINYSYADQSSSMNHFRNELEKPELAPYIAAIPGFSQAITELTFSQNHFEQAETDWKKARGKDVSDITPSQYRKEILEYLNKKLIPYLNVMNGINAPVYEGFYEAFTTIINDMNRVIKMREKSEE